MNRTFLNNAGLLVLAIVFSAGLMFAFVELPRLLDASLQNSLGFPQFDHGGGGDNALKTELFIQGLHLRWIGYASLLLILGLIVVGYSTRKSGWALAGAVGLFLPVFGQFAFSMFFLAGLGFLRVGWLPFLEVSSFDILDLGKVIYVPYWILNWILNLVKWNPHNLISWFFMGSGAFLFTWGVLLWFQSRYSGDQVATSRIYKISRHPQYLGWILWSYGFILYSPHERTMKMSWTVPDSLPWLLMTMTIVGICLLEEMKMLKITQGKYQQYRESSPFLFPLPRWLNRVLSWPARLVTGGEYPTRRRHVLWVVLIYTGILMSLSLFWMDLGKAGPGNGSGEESRQDLSEIVAKLDELGDNRREASALLDQIALTGVAGEDILLELASHPHNHVREFAIMHLGDKKVMEAEDLFLSSLNDSIRRVRSAAILAVGQIQSKRAVDSLTVMLLHPMQNNNTFHIYGALGNIGDPAAIPVLARGLEGGEHYNQTAALDAIMRIDPDEGLIHACGQLNNAHVEVRRHAVITCIKTGHPAVTGALEEVLEDEDFEVRFYARQGIKRLKK